MKINLELRQNKPENNTITKINKYDIQKLGKSPPGDRQKNRGHYKEKLDSKNKSQTQRARAYEATSFLSIDCEMSTDTC